MDEAIMLGLMLFDGCRLEGRTEALPRPFDEWLRSKALTVRLMLLLMEPPPPERRFILLESPPERKLLLPSASVLSREKSPALKVRPIANCLSLHDKGL